MVILVLTWGKVRAKYGTSSAFQSEFISVGTNSEGEKLPRTPQNRLSKLFIKVLQIKIVGSLLNSRRKRL